MGLCRQSRPLFARQGGARALLGMFVFAGVLLPLGASGGEGGLQFRSKRLRLQAQAGQRSVSGGFRFTNQSGRTITLTSIKNTCGCTTTTAEKRTYKAGETGTIQARMRLVAKTGRVSKSIYVFTDENGGGAYHLRFTVVVSDLVKVEPPELTWERTAAAEPKTVTVTAAPRAGALRLVGVECAKPGWKATVAERGKRTWRIRVTPPTDTSRLSTNTVTVKTQRPAEDPSTIDIPTRVKKREPTRQEWIEQLLE